MNINPFNLPDNELETLATAAAASPVSAAPRMSDISTAHTRQATSIIVNVDYHPTISMGTQYELMQALDSTFQELARKYKIPVGF